jgi:hypothetical protein
VVLIFGPSGESGTLPVNSTTMDSTTSTTIASTASNARGEDSGRLLGVVPTTLRPPTLSQSLNRIYTSCLVRQQALAGPTEVHGLTDDGKSLQSRHSSEPRGNTWAQIAAHNASSWTDLEPAEPWGDCTQPTWTNPQPTWPLPKGMYYVVFKLDHIICLKNKFINHFPAPIGNLSFK